MKRLLALLLCAALLVPACAALAETEGEKKALECALQYLDALYFSRSELYDQLLYEQYSPEEAAWAIGQLDYIDWFDQAAGFAEGQMKYSPEYSQLGLADLLLSCGFTAEEAKYGAAVAFGEKAEKPAVTSTPAPLPEISLFPVLPEVTTEPEGTPVPVTTPDLPASTPVPEVSPSETPAADDRHLEALQNAAAALSRVREGLSAAVPSDLVAQDLRESLYHLGSIVGEVSNNEILANIFSHFCIGK